ncbi:hypothetical protein RHMOL_Rhmol09G0211700 [Rhododendron molle]|uniref:Uncharacterized protein n=1 Tax=Rhododendron molle TaxID=49168 RepID=A0ACC0MFI7_RHOML|nr:hypothetical protein RHMOL_Rhmol09G0211700 [Rhododendron molle]
MNRNRIILDKAQAIWTCNKIMGLGYDGEEDEVISKFADMDDSTVSAWESGFGHDMPDDSTVSYVSLPRKPAYRHKPCRALGPLSYPECSA